jgi:glucosylceramidase
VEPARLDEVQQLHARGSMRRKYLGPYAQYFLRFLHVYAAEGVPIQAVTPQNEVDTDQHGLMPACIWPQEYEIEFVRNHLGPLLESSGTASKIWALDHNCNLWGRALAELEEPGLRKFCGAIAWHDYAGSAEQMSKIHDAFPDVEMHWTEGGLDYTSPDYLTDWTKWNAPFTNVLRNWCSSITAWNLALDERGCPNLGPFSCGGLLTIHSRSKQVVRSGQYWAFARYSRVIQRGARRFDSQSQSLDVAHVAVENPHGRRILILTRAGAGTTVEVRLGDLATAVPLDANSVTTLAWECASWARAPGGHDPSSCPSVMPLDVELD